MEIHNSEKKVDIGLGLLTNPNKKKKKKHFIVKNSNNENNKEEESNENKEGKCTEKDTLIQEFTKFINKTDNSKNIDIEYNELMESLINLQVKLIKHKIFIEKIEKSQP